MKSNKGLSFEDEITDFFAGGLPECDEARIVELILNNAEALRVFEQLNVMDRALARSRPDLELVPFGSPPKDAWQQLLAGKRLYDQHVHNDNSEAAELVQAEEKFAAAADGLTPPAPTEPEGA